MSATPRWVYPFKDDPLFQHLAIDTQSGVYKHRKKDARTRQYKPITLNTKDETVARAAYLEIVGEPVVENRKMTCQQAFDQWVDRLRARGRKSRTIRRYICAWDNDIKAEIGHRTVVSIEPRDVLAVIDKAKKRKARGGGKLGDSALYQIHATMSSLFTFCAQPTNGWRTDNPSAFLGEDKPSAPAITKVASEVVFTDDEVDAVATALDGDTWLAYQRKVIVQLSPEFGTRISEMLALQMDDVTLPLAVAGQPARKVGRLRIERQLAFYEDRKAADPSTWFDTLKGEDTRIGDKKRTVPISPFAVDILRAYIARGSAEGRLRPGAGLLFPNSVGRPLEPSRLAKHLREASKTVGREVRSHYFRHTYISTLVSGGTAIDTAAAFAGHDPVMTKQRYGHFQPDDALFEEVGGKLRQSKEEVA